jgi:hypothetical protein
MWIFLSAGVLMPALIPESVLSAGKTADIREAAANGWELQVRGRVRQHLQHFADHYMPAGTYSRIYASPDKDYNVRFYTSREAFADGVAAAARDIDYTKFKNTANRFEWGKKYHDLLLRIWSASTSLAPAGGFYGPRSKDNPRGYSPASKGYKKRGNPRKHVTGSTFFDDEDDYPLWQSNSIHSMTDKELEELDD